MDILTNYRNKIESLSEELIHCIEQYNLILKEKSTHKPPPDIKAEDLTYKPPTGNEKILGAWIIDTRGNTYTVIDNTDVK